VLDLGCGSGVCGIWAATRRRCEVVCTDINASAVRCTRANALLNNVEVEVRHGDLFEPVADEQFDVVVFNPPYYRGTPRDALDHAWRAPDVAERFAAELARHLTSGGSAAVVLSSDGDAGFPTAIAASSLAVEIVARRDLINEIQTVYQLRPC
jgi:release factor glutamine methyltransferase